MAKTLIGNIKGKDGRGISKVEKTATAGVVDTYTITYTDGTQSTYELRNSDDIAIQRQIVPSAAVESSTTASQAYGVGDYVVVNGTLKVVTAAIAKGSTFGASNTADTTVSGEIGKSRFKRLYSSGGWTVYASDWMVFISAVQIATGSGIWDTVQCPYVLPTKYRPSYTVYAAALTAVGESNTGYISVENDGKVYIGNMGGSTSSESRDASICYPVGI